MIKMTNGEGPRLNINAKDVQPKTKGMYHYV